MKMPGDQTRHFNLAEEANRQDTNICHVSKSSVRDQHLNEDFIKMSSEGFIKIPRSLLNSENWKSLNFRQKSVFLYLLEKVQYTPKIYRHHGKEIVILPGQYCTTYRRLVEEYNQSIKFKKEHIDVSFLQRLVSTCHAFFWCDTNNDTGITIITITYPELYDHFKSLIDTGFDTKKIQKRYTNKERQEGEECFKKEQQQKKEESFVGLLDVVFLERMRKVGLSEDEISSFQVVMRSKGFSKERIALGLDYISTEGFVPKATYIQALVWHCSCAIPPNPATIKVSIQDYVNSKYKDGGTYYGMNCQVNSNLLMFYQGMHSKPFPFDSPNVLECLKKFEEQQVRNKSG